MNFKVNVTVTFQKQAKSLLKKYPSLQTEFAELINNLKTEPYQGTPLGPNCLKIRLAIASKGKGKSGGARVITNIHVSESTVYLLSVYDKGDRQSITDQAITELLVNLYE